MSENENPEIPSKLASRYRVDARIGEGAHATTWRGWDERLDRPVAIKILHARLSDDPVFVQRFQLEAKVAASVRQANVVDIYDFGQEDGSLYIVMQYVDGEDLKALISRAGALSIRDARRIIGHVLSGLQAIHNAGIIHRDIKPQNILIGQDGIAQVTDFGIADAATHAGMTADGMAIGTVDYMSPEQAQGLPLSPSADLYSAGVVLYEMITGTLPFRGSTSRETMMQQINGVLTPPSVRFPGHGITPAIDAAIGQSLAKDPARRFVSARAMKQALGQAMVSGSQLVSHVGTTSMPSVAPTPRPYTHEPVLTHDEGKGLRRAWRSLMLLIVVGLIGISIWGFWQFSQHGGLDLSWPSFLPRSAPSIDVPPVPAVTETVPTNAPAPTQEVQQPFVPTVTPVPPGNPEEPPPIEPIEPDNGSIEVTPPIEPAG